MPRKVTEGVLGELEKLVRDGLTYEEIARKTGLSRPTVAVYLELPCEIVLPLIHDIPRTP